MGLENAKNKLNDYLEKAEKAELGVNKILKPKISENKQDGVERAHEQVLAEKNLERSLENLSLPKLDGTPEVADLSNPRDVVRVEIFLKNLTKQIEERGLGGLRWNTFDEGMA